MGQMCKNEIKKGQVGLNRERTSTCLCSNKSSKKFAYICKIIF